MNLSQIEQWFYSFSKSVPLELYTFVGSIIEEIIGIIPSPLVLTLAGSLALGDNKPLVYLFWLGVVGAAGKTFGGWVLYVIADKFEDVSLRFGKWVGVSHQTVESIEKFGKVKRMTGRFLFRDANYSKEDFSRVVC
jgi:membrane protein DedA with SNARE-associated domain